MMKSSQIHHKVFDFLATLPSKQKAQIAIKMLELFNNPRPHDSIQVKGSVKGCFRVDIGEYRIVYTFVDNELQIDMLGKRNDDEIYKKFKK